MDTDTHYDPDATHLVAFSAAAQVCMLKHLAPPLPTLYPLSFNRLCNFDAHSASFQICMLGWVRGAARAFLFNAAGGP
jgi:hypothetical protein